MAAWGALIFLGLSLLGKASAAVPEPPDTLINTTSGSVLPLPDRENMTRYDVSHLDAEAVCNDGSSGVYYHRSGTPLNATRWVIRFMGGAWCWDEASCQVRSQKQPYLMSTAMLPVNTSAAAHQDGIPDKVLRSAGITSIEAELNPFYSSWAHVHIWYCSSDSHLGDIAPGEDSDLAGWQFRGKRIAAAVMQDLLLQHDLAEATHVLLTGDSAGGVGAMNNADWIGSMLRQQAPQLQVFKAFIDGGWFLDIAPYASRQDGFTFQKAARVLAGPLQAAFDSSCTSFFGNESSWKCFFAAECFKHLATPVLFHQYLYDSANLGYDSAAWSQFDNFRYKMTESLQGAPAESWNTTSSSCAAGGACSAAAPALAPGSLTAAVEDAEGVSALSQPGSTSHQPGSAAAEPALAPRSLHSALEYEEGQPAVSQPERSMGSQPGAPAVAPSPAGARAGSLGPTRDGPAEDRDAGRKPNLFAPACHLHEIIDGVLFTKSAIGEVRLVEALEAWYAQEWHSVSFMDHTPGLRSDDVCGTDPKATELLAASMARYLVLEASHS